MAKKILGAIGIGGKKKAADASTPAAIASGPIIKTLGGAAPATAASRKRTRLRDSIMGTDTILRDTLGGN